MTETINTEMTEDKQSEVCSHLIQVICDMVGTCTLDVQTVSTVPAAYRLQQRDSPTAVHSIIRTT